MSRRDAPPESGPRLTRATRGARARLKAALTVRLDPEVLARVDAVAAVRSTEWREVTRAEVLRELVGAGLSELERSAPRGRHLRLVRPSQGQAGARRRPVPARRCHE